MSQGYRCHICGKSKVVGRSVSHSGVRTRKIFRPNLQVKHLVLDGRRIKVLICTKCLKKLKRETKVEEKPLVQQ